MPRAFQILSLRAAHSEEQAHNMLVERIDKMQPGEGVVYHQGSSGQVPERIKCAVRALSGERGPVLLVQRPRPGSELGDERIWQYIAIKKRK